MVTKISIQNLRKIYDTPERRVHALEGVNLNIEDGEFICLVGLSGCGKTTLLNMLAGFVEITAGTITMDGRPLTQDYDKGVVFQEYALFPWRTAQAERGIRPRDQKHARGGAYENRHGVPAPRPLGGVCGFLSPQPLGRHAPAGWRWRGPWRSTRKSS